MENDKRSITVEKPSEDVVRENLVEKFGERYAKEPMVEVEGYFFYLDPIGHGEDLFKAYFLDENSEEKRKDYLERSTEDFRVMAKLLKRYKVDQNDFRGVGQWGSVSTFSFCHGPVTDKYENVRYPDSKILLHRSYSTGKNLQYSFEGQQDIESFGFRVIENGISNRILDVQDDPEVEAVNLEDVFIDDIQKRMEWWQSEYGVKNRDLWQNMTDRLGTWLQEEITKDTTDPELWIKLVLSKMDFVKVGKIDLPPVREEMWKTNEVIDTLRRSIREMADYTDVRDLFKNDKKSMESALSRENRQLWKRIEDAITEGKEVYILEPNGLPSLPAIYLLVQWAAIFYSGEENIAKKDISEYWSRVKIVTKESLLDQPGNNQVLLVTGTSYDWDYESDEVDKPEIVEIRAKLGDRLVVADIASGKLR